MGRFRTLKPRIREILVAPDWRERLAELDDIPPRQATGPLYSLLLDKDEIVRWRAVDAFGRVAAKMADQRMEDGRVLMRMCMWRLNEESGNLGWGVPECMGEAMARHEGLAREFHSILASYVYCAEECDGNYLDHPLLRRGVFWALGRLAEVRPELVAPAARFLVDALEREEDPVNRGCAARALGLVLGHAPEQRERARIALEKLTHDAAGLSFYHGGEVRHVQVRDLVRAALDKA